MKHLNPYLFFNGNCKPAMEAYKACFGGELQVMTFGESNQDCPGGQKDWVMHAALKSPQFQLMASDNSQGNTKFGDNVSIVVDCSSKEELDKFYQALRQGGTTDMLPADTFWGAYFGTLTDAFGVNWMFNCQA